MAGGETNVVNAIMKDLSLHGVVLWKNVRGKFYAIDCVKELIAAALSLNLGRIKLAIKRLRLLRAGFGPDGASDLIGFRRVVITPEMVGQTVAVFIAIEVKKEGGRPSPEQIDYCRFVEKNGGLSGVSYGCEDSRRICKIKS